MPSPLSSARGRPAFRILTGLILTGKILTGKFLQRQFIQGRAIKRSPEGRVNAVFLKGLFFHIMPVDKLVDARKDLSGQRERFAVKNNQRYLEIVPGKKTAEDRRGDLQCLRLRKTIDPGRDQGESDAFYPELERFVKAVYIAVFNGLFFAVYAALPDRADSVENVFRVKIKSRCYGNVTLGDAADLPALGKKPVRACRSVDRGVCPALIYRLGICGVDDRVSPDLRDIIPDNLKSHFLTCIDQEFLVDISYYIRPRKCDKHVRRMSGDPMEAATALSYTLSGSGNEKS